MRSRAGVCPPPVVDGGNVVSYLAGEGMKQLRFLVSCLLAGWVVLQAIGIGYDLLISVIVERSR
jgi:hypothetical protein